MPSGNVDKPVIEDNRDGTVSIRYDPREEGSHELALKYNGEHVQGILQRNLVHMRRIKRNHFSFRFTIQVPRRFHCIWLCNCLRTGFDPRCHRRASTLHHLNERRRSRWTLDGGRRSKQSWGEFERKWILDWKMTWNFDRSTIKTTRMEPFPSTIFQPHPENTKFQFALVTKTSRDRRSSPR